jgi:hypothetical protein
VTVLLVLGTAAALAVWAAAVFAAPRRRAVLLAALLVAGTLVALEARSRVIQGLGVSGGAGVGLALAAAAASLVALPTLDAYFLGDDFGYVTLFHGRPWLDLFRLGEISDGIWGKPLDEFRPLFALAWRLGVLVHGTDAVSWHLGNAALHAVAVALVVLLARSVGTPALVATLAGFLFAVAPAHAEAVAWVTGRVDLLPTLFYLGSFVLFRRFRASSSRPAYVLSLLLFAAGLFFKEILLTLPVLLAASDLWLDRDRLRAQAAGRGVGRFIAVHLPFVLVTLLYLTLRFLAVGSFAREERVATRLGLGLYFSGTSLRLRWLLLPLSPPARAGERLDVASVLVTGLILGSLLALAVLLLRGGGTYARARALFLFFGVFWPAVTFLPLLVTYPSPRHLYLPLAGVAVGLAVALLPVEREGIHGTPLRVAWAVVLLVLHAALLVRAELRWSEAGRVSRALVEGLSARLEALPPGAFVVVTNVPSVAPDRRSQVWSYALPFALQPPHVTPDQYSRHQVLESPDVYCCSPAVWWERKREFVLRLVYPGEPEDVDLTLLHWNPRRREVVQRQARLPRRIVRDTVEAALRERPEDVDALTHEAANRLVLDLAQTIRHEAANLSGRGSAAREEDEGHEDEHR